MEFAIADEGPAKKLGGADGTAERFAKFVSFKVRGTRGLEPARS
jgi:hypothetical protein